MVQPLFLTNLKDGSTVESEKKPVDAPEPLSPPEHEKALELEESRRAERDRAADGDAASELPQVHSDDV